MKNFLSLGSVVKVRGTDQLLMIYGRLQKSASTGAIYDYLACEYPSGSNNPSQGYLFNDEDIQEIFYIGFQDVDEFNYKLVLEDYLENTAMN